MSRSKYEGHWQFLPRNGQTSRNQNPKIEFENPIDGRRATSTTALKRLPKPTRDADSAVSFDLWDCRPLRSKSMSRHGTCRML